LFGTSSSTMANPYSVMYDSLPPPAAATAAAAAATNTEAAAGAGVSGSNKRPADTPASSSSGGGLPAGWKKVPSRSRPGAFTYENQYVGPSRPGDVGEWASAVCAVSCWRWRVGKCSVCRQLLTLASGQVQCVPSAVGVGEWASAVCAVSFPFCNLCVGN